MNAHSASAAEKQIIINPSGATDWYEIVLIKDEQFG
jgi:hypothetical protein